MSNSLSSLLNCLLNLPLPTADVILGELLWLSLRFFGWTFTCGTDGLPYGKTYGSFSF